MFLLQMNNLKGHNMFKMIKLFTVLSLLLSSFAIGVEDKIYLNEDDVKATYDRFYIHQGDNIWLETNALHRDSSGLFTFQTNLTTQSSKGLNAEYVKKWRCPYCNRYWPIGQACQNPDCPSKYK